MFREISWRVGRKMYCWARRDVANDPTRNGEYWLLQQVLTQARGHPLMIDVGANKGDWSNQALTVSRMIGSKPTIHAFEPDSGTRKLLKARLAGAINVWPLAVSSTLGEAQFYSSHAGSGTNSLAPLSGRNIEIVKLTTIDAFLADQAIGYVTMLKIDTEGFDFDVLRGARKTIAEGRIDIVQFEYNWRWLQNHASLFDVFNLVVGTDYRVGKLVKGGIIIYERWHFEIDRYFEANYLLLKNGSEIARLAKTYCFDINNVLIET